MTGDRLDGLGDNIGLKRSGRDDDDFRRAIAAELLVLRSNGTADELIAIIFVLVEDTAQPMEFVEYFPKTIYIRFIDAPFTSLPAGTAERWADTIRRAMSAATELLFVYGYRLDADLFTLSSQGAVTESSSSSGLADVSKTSGGRLSGSA